MVINVLFLVLKSFEFFSIPSLYENGDGYVRRYHWIRCGLIVLFASCFRYIDLISAISAAYHAVN